MKRMKREFRVGGMTCINCQHTLERGLSDLPGMSEVSVSYTDARASVVYDPRRLTFERIADTVRALGYEVVTKEARRAQVLRTILLPSAIIAAYALLERFGVLNLLVPGQLAQSSMSYGMLLVVGLLTSAHCIAMCGGINLSACLPDAVKKEDKKAAFALSPSVMYNLGRVISYTAGGFFLGLIGMLLGGDAGAGIPARIQGALKLFAGAVMVVMGVNMLGIFPWLRRLNPRMPGFAAKWIGKRRASASGPFVIGLLNGLMPCGPLQSIQILALGSGSPAAGALSMLMFSLGTVPLMLGLGTLVSALGKRFAHQVTTVGAMLVAVLGLAMMAQGGSLSGLFTVGGLLFFTISLTAVGVAMSVPASRKARRLAGVGACVAVIAAAGAVRLSSGPAGMDLLVQEPAENSVQLVESTLSPWQYPTITVKAGTPVRWTIQAPERSINGCNATVILPEYDIVHTFEEGENVIEFMPEETGTFAYSCWMGMIRGNIVVN